ncbi:hypothetical protein [Leifsonia sp. LS-T14]
MTAAEAAGVAAPAAAAPAAAAPLAAPRPALIPLATAAAVCDGDTCALP